MANERRSDDSVWGVAQSTRSLYIQKAHAVAMATVAATLTAVTPR